MVNTAVDAVLQDAIDLRRFLHQQPELSGSEEKTARLIANQCRELGLEVQENIGGYGVVARLHIDPDKAWIAFRADMDALPIHEATQHDYTSTIANVSHSCGHDAHTAILLTVVKVLHQQSLQHKNLLQLQYNIMFIFQPAEETCQGAAAMLNDGLFDDIQPAQIYALHVYPYLPAGSIGLRAGAMCAAADMFEVKIHGRGGHAACPHECIDVILMASHIIQALHHIPGCLFRLGTGSSPATRYPLHHPCFDIDESSLRSGIALFTALALSAKQ